MVGWKALSSRPRLVEPILRGGSLGLVPLRTLQTGFRGVGGWKGCRMASTGANADSRGAAAVVLTNSTASKVRRTPVILNHPRKPSGAHFKVLQWNVLADGLAQNGDFCRVEPGCLEWEYRKPLLLQEIREANADIICLQELNHFDDLSQALRELGYEGAFREKHASPALKYEKPPDGMAVFYRRERFACSAGGVEGRSFQDDDTGREQSQGYLQILLRDLVVGRELLVVTTHLKAKDGAECEDMRHHQARQLLRHVEDTVERRRRSSGGQAGTHGAAAAAAAGGGGSSGNGACASGSGSRNGTGALPVAYNGNGGGNGSGGAAGARGAVVPVIVTGDFNALPGSKTCNAFREHPLALRCLWDQRPLDATLSSESDMDQPPPPPPPAAAGAARNSSIAGIATGAGANGQQQVQQQAQAQAQAQQQQLWSSEFSTWKFRVKGESKRISDYIYFSGCGLLRPLQRWRMLTEAEIGPGALPSPSYASDHVSLCCEFEWDTDADLEWAPSGKEQDWG